MVLNIASELEVMLMKTVKTVTIAKPQSLRIYASLGRVMKRDRKRSLRNKILLSLINIFCFLPQYHMQQLLPLCNKATKLSCKHKHFVLLTDSVLRLQKGDSRKGLSLPLGARVSAGWEWLDD